MARNSSYLFRDRDLGDLIRGYEAEIQNEVERWERNKVLAASEPDLVAYLVDKYTLEPPVLDRDGKYVESEGETQIDLSGRPDYGVLGGPRHVPGAYVTIAIPFGGDPDLFSYRASSWNSMPPRGQIVGSHVRITFSGVKLDPEQTRKEIDAEVNRINEYLKWTKNNCEVWNARVQGISEKCVQVRK